LNARAALITRVAEMARLGVALGGAAERSSALRAPAISSSRRPESSRATAASDWNSRRDVD
jgi:hypothetical protein